MSGETERRRALLACAAIVAIGTALRLPPLFNDLWLDEVWTWFSARKLTSPVEVFTAIHHSNNNHLNTLFFQLLGEHWPGAVYRLPAFASGVGGLVLAVAEPAATSA